MDWETQDNNLVKDFEFENFNEAISFVNKIRRIAEEEGHHPDMLIHAGNKVKIMLTSHHEGKITDKDYEMAQKINEI